MELVKDEQRNDEKNNKEKCSLHEEDEEQHIDKVNELIEECHKKYDIEYGGFLANHTIHGLIALFGLNEKEEVVQEWFREYAEHEYGGHKMEPAKPFDPSVVINDENFDSFIGAKENFQELFEYFKKELRSNSLDDVINKYYPKLMKGVGGGALHGVIHLGWALYYRHNETAIAEDNEIEIKWINEAMEQSKNENENEIKSIENLNSKSENLFQIFFKIEKDDRFQKLIQSNFFAEKGFQERLKKTVKKFNQLIFEDFSSKIPPITINHLIISLSKMFFYTKENDFFLLHLITALFGIYHILQFPIEEKIKLWVIWNYFHLSLIGYIAEGAPSFSPRFSSFDLNDIPLVDSSWDYLVDHFLTNVPSRNEHIIKIVMVMKEFEKILPSHSNLFKHIAIDTMEKNKLVFFSGKKSSSEISFSTPSSFSSPSSPSS